MSASTAESRGGIHSLRYMPALDGMRGLAVAGVLLYHSNLMTGGFLGVDAFFVLSGFLITTLLLNEARSSGRIKLSAFWARRARRLLPALFLVIGAVAVYASVYATASELGVIRSEGLATLGYVANWRAIFTDSSYWQLFQSPSPLAHTWSLAIEEQFYLMWPLVVFFLARRTTRAGDRSRLAIRVLGLAVMLAAASQLLMFLLYKPDRDSSRVYFGTDTRASSILMGAALAALVAWRGHPKAWPLRAGVEILGIAGVGALAWAWLSYGGEDAGLYRGGFLLCGLAATTVIAAGANPRTGLLARALAVKPLRALGVISYGVYLWHWPIYLVLDPDRTGLDGWALFALRATATIAISIVSFVLVERPIRTAPSFGRPARGLVPIAAAGCVVALVLSTQGALPVRELAAPTSQAHVEEITRTGEARGVQTRLLVVGDSVAFFLGEYIDASQSSLQVIAANGAVGGCVFASGPTQVRDIGRKMSVPHLVAPTPCEPHWYDTATVFKPNEVLLLHGARGTFADVEFGTAWSSPCQPRYDRWYEHHLRESVEHFTANGAFVWLVTLPVDVADWTPLDSRQRATCQNVITRRVARAESARGVGLIDLDVFLCPGGVCTTRIDGRKVRPDGVHFEGPGAAFIGAWLVQQIRDNSVNGVT